jgi:glutamyl-Q tRNA(Asp) synthetase
MALSRSVTSSHSTPTGQADYCGRFAPSPTGPLHLGSLVAALASWLDARAHAGRWLVRIEDIDPPREDAGAARAQLAALTALGLLPDEPPTYQSNNSKRYLAALAALQAAGSLYSCRCSRTTVEQAAQRLGLPPTVYPGTCRDLGLTGESAALRVRVPADRVAFVDRACGDFSQQLERDVGDFVVRRADGLWAYQLAVVVDDAAQKVTDVVRGADLLDNTPRQIYLQRLLQLPVPCYLHVPVVRNAAGEKLSKQTGAEPLNLSDPVGQLERAWQLLGFEATGAATVGELLARAVSAWQARWCRARRGVDTIEEASLPPSSRPGAEPNRRE